MKRIRKTEDYLYRQFVAWKEYCEDKRSYKEIKLEDLKLIFYRSDNSLVAMVIKDSVLAGFFELEKTRVFIFPFLRTVRMPHIYLLPEYRGMKIAKRLYLWAITRYHLLTSQSHTAAAGRVWRSLWNDERIKKKDFIKAILLDTIYHKLTIERQYVRAAMKHPDARIFIPKQKVTL